MTIVEFLTARYAEEEQAARAADEYSRRVSGPDRPDAGMQLNMDLPALIVDERRVLREVAAKRLVIEMHPAVDGRCEGCGIELENPTGCLTLRALALPYAEHPDFDPAWRTP